MQDAIKALYKTAFYKLVLTEDRFDIDIPKYNQASYNFLSYFKESIVLALLLTYHPHIAKFTKAVRQKHNMETVLQYPRFKSWNALNRWVRRRLAKNYNTISVTVKEFLDKSFIPQRWCDSLIIKILTDVLPLPKDIGPVVFHAPMSDSSTTRFLPRNHNRWLKEGLESVRYMTHRIYPTIFIEGRIDSKNALTEWVNENWETSVFPSVKILPKPWYEDIDLDKLTMGLHFWQLRTEKQMGWGNIDEMIKALEETDVDFFGKDGIGTPTKIDLQKLVSITKKRLNDFHSLKT